MNWSNIDDVSRMLIEGMNEWINHTSEKIDYIVGTVRLKTVWKAICAHTGKPNTDEKLI